MSKISQRQIKVYVATVSLLVTLIAGVTQHYYPTQFSAFSTWLNTPLFQTVTMPRSVLGEAVSETRETATVAKVIDGDTIELSDGRKVRYIGMDTPETHHPTKKPQCFGQEAAARNQQLVAEQTVELEKDVSETDRYGRLLRYVWLNGVLVNQQLVAEGLAVARSYPPDVAHQDELRQAEAQARATNQGLWAACPELTSNE